MSPELIKEQFISSSEAAKLFGYTPDYVARLCREGKVVSTRVGRAWLVERKSLEAYRAGEEVRRAEAARELAEARAVEYRSAQTARRPVPSSYAGRAAVTLAAFLIVGVLAAGATFLGKPSAQPTALGTSQAAAASNPAESAALFTYRALQALFDAAGSALASLFDDETPVTVAPSAPSVPAPAASPAPAVIPAQSAPQQPEAATNVTTITNVTRDLHVTVTGLSKDAVDDRVREHIDNLVDQLEPSGGGTGNGSVTSVDASGGTTGLSFAGGPVTGSGTLTLSGTLAAGAGGTGHSSFAVGDILYADTTGTLARLPVGSGGQVLKVAGGVPSWSADLQGAGGAGAWATTTDSLAIYPSDPTNAVIIGANATTTAGNLLEVAGSTLIRSALTAYGSVSAPSFTATTTSTSTLPSLAATRLSLGSDYITDITGTGLTNAAGVLTLNATGDWTGTFDGQEGTYYLSRANHTGTQLASTISDFSSTARGLFSAAAPLQYNSSTGAFTYTGLATTSQPSSSNLLVSNGAAGVYGVATSSATLGLGLSGSITGLGGSNTLSIATSSLFTGTTGQVAYFDGANSLTGTSSLFVAANGNIGVGTTTSNARLHVHSASAGAGYSVNTAADEMVLEHDNNGGISIAVPDNRDANFFLGSPSDNFGAGLRWNLTDDLFHVGTANAGASLALEAGNQSEVMRLLSTGLVGIGTTSPWAQLSVNPSGIAGPAFTIGSSTKTDFIVTNGGRVGIGTSSPYGKLDVHDGTVYSSGASGGAFEAKNPGNQNAFVALSWLSNIPRIRVGGTGTGSINGLEIQGPGDSLLFKIDGGGDIFVPGGDIALRGSNPALRFTDTAGTATYMNLNYVPADSTLYIRDNSAAVNRFAFTQSGSVGIGTSTPYARLSVLGDAAIAGDLSAANLTATGTASTTNLAITGLASSLLKTNALGQVVAAVAGTDYASFGYPFPNNATTTGLGLYASTTIGAGGATTGLTISGNATTTGSHLINGIRISSGGSNSIVIGVGSTVGSHNGVTIGTGSTGANSSIVIGNGVSAESADQIVFGTPNSTGSTTVYLSSISGAGTVNSVIKGRRSTNNVGGSIFINGGTGVAGNGNVILGYDANSGVVGNVGVATSSPYAKLSVHVNNGDTNTTLFAIGSSTAAATTTLLSVNNKGALLLSSALSSGSAAQPKDAGYIGVESASNTGLYFSGNDRISVQVTNGDMASFTAGGFVAGNNQSIGWSSNQYPGYQAIARDTSLSRLAVGVVGVGTASVGSSNGTLVAERIGLGTTTPYAQLAVVATSTNGVGAPRTLFAIASTTAGTATTTLFSIDNAGAVSAASGGFTVNSAGTQVRFAAASDQNSPQLGAAGETTGLAFRGSSNNTIGLVVSGTARFNVNALNSTPQLTAYSSSIFGFSPTSGGSGWAAAADTGLSRVAAGTVGIGLGTASDISGTLAAERIGLGTTTPYAQLSIVATSTNGVGAPTTLFAVSSTTAGTATSTLFVVNNSGQVGIGSLPISSHNLTLPTSQWFTQDGAHVYFGNNQNTYIGERSNSNGLQLRGGGNSGNHTVFINSGGELSLGDNGPSYKLSVTGTTTSGYFGLSSGFSVDGDVLAVTNAGSMGLGSTSPWGQFSIHANNGATNRNLFVIGSSTASATTTLLSVSNTGNIGGRGSHSSSFYSGISIQTATNVTHIGSTGGDTDFVQQNSSEIFGWSGSGIKVPSTRAIGWTQNTSTTVGLDTALSRLSAGVIGLGNGSVGTINGTFAAERIGLGTTSPYAQLSVVATSTNGVGAPRTLFAIASTTAGTATSTHLVVTNTGKVGIGTENPGEKLEVKDGIISLTGSAAGGADTRISFARTDTGATSWLGIPNWGSSSFYIYGPTASSNEIAAQYGGATWSFYTGGSERIRVDSAGNVGIGTSSPQNALHVAGSGSAARLRIDAGPSATGAYGLSFYEGQQGALGGFRGGVFSDASNGDDLVLYGGGSNGSDPQLVIDGPTNNIGIGTTSPGYPLDVYGGIRTHGWGDATAGNVLFGGAATESIYGGGGGHLLAFYTNGSERMRITDTGSVDIGSGASPGNALRYFDVTNTNTGSSAGSILRLISSDAAGSGTFSADFVKYKTGGLVINNNETNSAAFTSFGVGPSERLRITSSGNVGIGTTSPVGLLALEQGTEPHSLFIGNQGSSTPSLSVRGVNGNGNVGIGILTPTEKLQILGGTGAGLRIDDTTEGSGNNLIMRSQSLTMNRTGSAQNFVISTTGTFSGNNLHFKADNNTTFMMSANYSGPAALASATANDLCYNDAVSGMTGINVFSTCSSASRYKDNIEDLSNEGLATVRALRAVEFDWKGTGEHDFGFIAEEVEAVDPLFATYRNGVIEGVKYKQMSAVLVKAIQELDIDLQSLASTTFEEAEEGSFVARFFARLVAWLDDAENGIANIFVGSVKARDTVCVGETCVTEEQLKALLELAGEQGGSQGGGEEPQAEEPPAEEPPAEDLAAEEPAEDEVPAEDVPVEEAPVESGEDEEDAATDEGDSGAESQGDSEDGEGSDAGGDTEAGSDA